MDTLERPNYEGDFVLWFAYQAELLRQGRVSELDLDNLAKEVESIEQRHKREVYSRSTALSARLLNYKFQSGKHSWLLTMREQCRQLELIFQDSPSLAKSYAPSRLNDIYRDARLDASDETGLSLETFPETCPYALEQVLNEDFLPEGKRG